MTSHVTKTSKTAAQQVAAKIHDILASNDNATSVEEGMLFDLYNHANYPRDADSDDIIEHACAVLSGYSSEDVDRYAALVKGMANRSNAVGVEALQPFLSAVANALKAVKGGEHLTDEVDFYHAKGNELEGLIVKGARMGLFADNNPLQPARKTNQGHGK